MVGYKDKEKQRQFQKEWQQKNKERLAEKQRQNRIERRKWWRELKAALECKECGESHPAILDFHHPKEGMKDSHIDTISNKFFERKFSYKRILKEIDDCWVLCANCHRKLHYRDDL